MLVCITLCHTSTCNLNTIVICTVQSCRSSLCHWKWTTKTNTECMFINQLYIVFALLNWMVTWFFSVCCVNLVSVTEIKLTSSFGSSIQRSDFQRQGLIYPSLFYFHFQVIVKFIRKAKILVDCWIDDPILGSIPLEIALLAKLKHPNIVKVNIIFTFSLCYLMNGTEGKLLRLRWIPLNIQAMMQGCS